MAGPTSLCVSLSVFFCRWRGEPVRMAGRGRHRWRGATGAGGAGGGGEVAGGRGGRWWWGPGRPTGGGGGGGGGGQGGRLVGRCTWGFLFFCFMKLSSPRARWASRRMSTERGPTCSRRRRLRRHSGAERNLTLGEGLESGSEI
jgi:hypothetical protein